MEAIPPLPWAADVQGGTLKLSKAVSLQDLIDGVLVIKVTSNHGETDGKIKEYPSDNKIYIDDGNGNFMYKIERFEGSSKTIRLTKTESTLSTETLISVELPAVIAPLGDVQIFKDRFGYEYATGVLSKVYARINNPWVGLNSGWIVGVASDEGTCFTAIAPDIEGDPYGMTVWIDWYAPEIFTPYEEGEMVEITYYAGESFDVTSYETIFSKP